MTEDISKDEFDAKTDEIEGGFEAADPQPVAEEVPLLTFAELLDLREDISEADGQLDSAAGYWAQVAVALEQQGDDADDRAEFEKADALTETAGKARSLAERIDGGKAVTEVEEALEDAQADDE